MKKSLFAGLSLIVVVLMLVSACSKATSVPATAAPATDTPTTAATMTDAEMKALITERCGVSTCHSASIVFNSSFSQSRWSTVFDQMIGLGANVTADEKVMMIDWLLAN